MQQTVARIFDRMPERQAPEPAPQPAPDPLALGFDPAVRNPQPTMVADPDGPIAAIYRNLGTASAEQVVTRELAELAHHFNHMALQVRELSDETLKKIAHELAENLREAGAAVEVQGLDDAVALAIELQLDRLRQHLVAAARRPLRIGQAGTRRCR